jgi:membrane protease YdiL (CAAX protease family)
LPSPHVFHCSTNQAPTDALSLALCFHEKHWDLVMKELKDLLPTYLATVLTFLLFVGAHLPDWLSHGGPTPAVLANAFGIFVFSVVACGLFARTASVWPPTLAHIANNILSSLLVARHI